MIRFLASLGLAAFAVAVLLCAVACVSVRNKDGVLETRISRFADEAEVDAVAEKVDGVEAALNVERSERTAADAQIRTDIATADGAAVAAFTAAIAQGKTAAEAQAAASAAAAGVAQTLAAEARAAAAVAQKAADDEAKARAEQYTSTISETRGSKIGILEVLAIAAGTTGAGGVGLNVLRNRSRRRSLAAVAKGVPPAAAV